MAEVPDSLIRKDRDSLAANELVHWHTYSYRAVALLLLGVLTLIGAVLLAIFPQWRSAVSSKLFGSDRGANAGAEIVTNRQARFTNLDGTVQVRKAKEVQWTSASMSLGLDEGDLIQTGKDGVARIAFADGTLYVVNPNTLIAVETNDIPSAGKGSNVAVQVTSGAVDLSTSRLDGQSRVLFANAEASLHEQSRAMVSNDPDANVHQITVAKGEASLRRGAEQLTLNQYDEASFQSPESPIVKTKINAPPILLSPPNMAPVAATGTESAEVDFGWTAMPDAAAYHIRISSSPLFSSLIYDRRIEGTSVHLPNFKEGDYYWSVTSIDAHQKESQQSDPDQFSVVREESPGEIVLVVEKTIQHGKVVEIVGRTEPGATVLINNEPVFSMAANGSFKHFTAPFPTTGPNRITITAQNREGKVATLRKTVVLQ